MPNWCSNTAKIAHKDKDTVIEAAKAIREGRWLEWVQPLPEDIANSEDGEVRYHWRIDNWGTKWDIDGAGLLDSSGHYLDHECDIEECVYKVGEDWVAHFTFDTAWSPPVETYQHLSNNGWHVIAFYDEGGVAFCGRYSTDDGDFCVDYPDTDNKEEVEEWIKSLPADLEEQYGLADRMRDPWWPEEVMA